MLLSTGAALQRDDDCDGATDEGCTTWYADTDGDGYGDPGTSVQSITQPAGYVADSTDCNDGNAAVNPGAAEVCNGIDDNCDGQTDEGLPLQTYYLDADGDGYGSADNTTEACSQFAGYVSDNSDCNDNSSSISPDAAEACNGIDDNCNGQIDDGLPEYMYYRDADDDGYGDPVDSLTACEAPEGYVSDNTDCNDNDPTVHDTCEPCVLKVFPHRISKVQCMLKPINWFILSSNEPDTFTRFTAVDWGTNAIETVLTYPLGKKHRFLFVVTRIKSRYLKLNDFFEVRVNDCTGSLRVGVR